MISRPTLVVAVSIVLTLGALSGCTDNGDESSAQPDDSSDATSVRSADAENSDSSDDSSASTTEVLRPGVVAFDGSVEDLVLELPEARNFAGGIEEWLIAVPGQEGVLRNSRGITLFVPVDEGFSDEARSAEFADPDIAALTIGEHLHVGVLDELDGSVTVASGTEYAVGGDGTTIGGRSVLRVETATNGVVYLIDGPLADTAG